MTKYERELQDLKPSDTVQNTTTNIKNLGYDFITTAGHGYLVVPKNDKLGEAVIRYMKIEYGFIGNAAYYLEEDCEAPLFIDILNAMLNKDTALLNEIRLKL